MTMVDPIADFLTRIRNAGMASFDKVEMPKSKIKLSIAKLLQSEGYISNYELAEDSKQGKIIIYLKYNGDKTPVIKGLKMVSKPSCRVYSGYAKIPKVLNGLGVNIISTSKGVMTDRDARRMKIGGEIICSVW